MDKIESYDENWFKKTFPDNCKWFTDGVTWLEERGFENQGKCGKLFSREIQSNNHNAFAYFTVKAHKRNCANENIKEGWSVHVFYGNRDGGKHGDEEESKIFKDVRNAFLDLEITINNAFEHIKDENKTSKMLSEMQEEAKKCKAKETKRKKGE